MGPQKFLEVVALESRVCVPLYHLYTYSSRKIQIATIRNQNARTGLSVLLKILRGDRDTIAEVSDSWQEYVASMAFFSRPFTLGTYKDVQQLYDDAMEYGFNIDNTLPSEVASAALFTCDLPRVAHLLCSSHVSRLLSTFSKPTLRWQCTHPISCPKVASSMNLNKGNFIPKRNLFDCLAKL